LESLATRIVVALKLAAHDFPPMIALRGVHVHEVDADSSLPAMADDRAHLKSSPDLRFLNSKMNFDFCSDRILPFA